MKIYIYFLGLFFLLFGCSEDDLSDILNKNIEPDQQHDEQTSNDPNSNIFNNGVVINIEERPEHFELLYQLPQVSSFELVSSSVAGAVIINDKGQILVNDPLLFDAQENPNIELMVEVAVFEEMKEIPIFIQVSEGESISSTTFEIAEEEDKRFELTASSSDTLSVNIRLFMSNQKGFLIKLNQLPNRNETAQYIIAPEEIENENFAYVAAGRTIQNVDVLEDKIAEYGYVDIARSEDDIYEITLSEVLFFASEENDSADKNYEQLDIFSFKAMHQYTAFILNADFGQLTTGGRSYVSEVDDGQNLQFFGGLITIPKSSTSGQFTVSNIPTDQLTANVASMDFIVRPGGTTRRFVGTEGTITLRIVDGFYLFNFENITLEQTFPAGGGSGTISGYLNF